MAYSCDLSKIETWTIMDYQGLSWTVMNCHELSWTIISHRGLFQIKYSLTLSTSSSNALVSISV